MAEDRDVDVLEIAVADQPGFRSDELLGDARPDLDRAGQALALHDFLDREHRRDVHRLTGVVALAVARRALDDRIVVRDAGLLRGLRNPVDVGPDRDDRLPAAPRRHPRRRNAGDAAFDLESVLLEDAREIFRGFDLLKAQLAVAEHLVDDLLRELAHRVDVGDGIFLQRVEFRVDGRRQRRHRRGRFLGSGGQADRDARNDDKCENRFRCGHVFLPVCLTCQHFLIRVGPHPHALVRSRSRARSAAGAAFLNPRGAHPPRVGAPALEDSLSSREAQG